MIKNQIRNKDVTLPITITGEGQQIIFFNGGGATQISWKKVIQELKDNYQIVTFDFRGHGKASAASDYSFDAFLSDAEIVMNTLSNKPIIVGWSLGADLALAYAVAHPNKVAGLVLIDGAVPLTEPLIENETQLRQSLKSPIMKLSRLLIRFTPYNYQVWGDAFADIVVELDARRQGLLGDYSNVSSPITMVLAEKSGGLKGAHAERNNKIWRTSAERLTTKYPSISIQWIDDTHQLPFKHPIELAKTIDKVAASLRAVN
jgi:pimeloyl-ACP methyl ester carboxylesterase